MGLPGLVLAFFLLASDLIKCVCICVCVCTVTSRDAYAPKDLVRSSWELPKRLGKEAGDALT